MGLLAGAGNLTEFITLKIQMEYPKYENIGIGSAQWTTINPHPIFSESKTQIAISALNYGRALAIQKITRNKLFYYVDKLSLGLLERGEADFYEWSHRKLWMKYYIWPWKIEQNYNGGNRKVYTATMIGKSDGTLGINLDMAFGLEKVLIPSAALIPLFILANKLELKEREKLGQVLLAMNRYYKTPEAAGVFLSEMKAFESAVQILL